MEGHKRKGEKVGFIVYHMLSGQSTRALTHWPLDRSISWTATSKIVRRLSLCAYIIWQDSSELGLAWIVSPSNTTIRSYIPNLIVNWSNEPTSVAVPEMQGKYKPGGLASHFLRAKTSLSLRLL